MAKNVAPVATYRVQLSPDFGFAELRRVLKPIVALGVSHLYLSPILAAMPGSTHGYDWAPPARINPELGGFDEFARLRASAARRGLGLILDIVPHHVGIADPASNPWWADILRHGLDSPYASWFDLLPTPDGIIELPVLGADGIEAVRLDDDGNLVYHDRVFPTADGTAGPGATAAEVADRQHYRLVPHASGRYGYRRFTDVTDLAALRLDVAEVYDATHGWLRDLVADDLVDGVRVDNLDGIAYPADYLRRLRTDLGPDRLVYVEKMLAPLERLSPDFACDGTTGYEQLAVLGMSFTSHAGLRELSELSEMTTGINGDATWTLLEQQKLKRDALARHYSAEHARMAVTLSAAIGEDAPAIAELCDATAEMIALMPVTRPDHHLESGLIREIGDVVADGNPLMRESIPLVLDAFEATPAAAAQLGQLCASVYTTAVENTLFYRNPRLVSLNELGCQAWLGLPSLTRFHAANAERAARHPLALTAVTTHDTKRSEDVRRRISMLSQVPQRWALAVAQITRSAPFPEPVIGMFVLQNIFGAWPVDDEGAVAPDEQWRERMRGYAVKAVRESGQDSSWSDPDAAFEARLTEWVDTVTGPDVSSPLVELVDLTFDAWRDDATAHKVVSLLCPGVGDIYQGTQWWTDSLTDPDNRRPVDYEQSLNHPKARAIIHALSVRRRHPDAFGPGSAYFPLTAQRDGVERILAFGRGPSADADPRVIVVCARFTYSFTEQLQQSTSLPLPPGTWHDRLAHRRFTGEAAVDALLDGQAFAVLERR
ncbi:malto-oligosyltrehalose synthase [Gordonia crocea]|uniref:Putative maltooligosyl trehalose synthase n=1 Tax=Gordonia crocea TaxID=589162 RepID=A0A7I9UZ97_9ACTN|nr:malto-oligosyltrehalose synthase [Gordonia crocea]GED98242.1 putative maltooligosyl trehalose synthase [Gordonia crocea]